MKNIVVAIACLMALKSFSQSNETIVEEKSSDWIKVAATTTMPKPKKATTVKKKNNSNRSTTPKKDVQEEFEKTNNEVNRFKKQKKG